MKATARWLEGEAYLRIDQPAKARPLIESAYRIARDAAPDSKLLGDVLASMGGVMAGNGSVAKALRHYQDAHEIYRKLRDLRSQSKALIQIAILYNSANDWTSALKYFEQAIDAYDADSNLLFSIHNGRGNALKELDRTSEADAEFKIALGIARDLGSPLLESTVYNNLARLALDHGNLADADRAIAGSFQAIGKDAPTEFRKQQMALAAQAAYQHGDYRRARALIETSFENPNSSDSLLVEREAHKTAYLIFERIGRYDLALPHLRAWKRLDDKATMLARSANAALMGARFDFANQALKIANLKAEDAQKSAAFERSRAETQRLVFSGAAVATMILIAMLLYALRLTRRSRAKVQAANDDLAVSNDALAKALAAKTEFLATTSHEIRTPLNGILGMTQVMLVDRSLDPVTRDRLTVVHDAGETMKALVDDILDVAKMETGNLTIDERPFDLRALMLTASDLWSEQAKVGGVTFTLDLGDCPEEVHGDGPRVRQILFNLLANAVKFTRAGCIALTVARAGDGMMRLSVSDTGIGIAPDKIETIFDSFKQADASTTREFGGTGLGLTIARNLARAMGGDVTVQSVMGQGTTFVVSLPLSTVQAASAKPSAAREAPADLAIVGGSPISRSMLKTVLAAEFPRTVLSDGDEVASTLAGATSAMVLIDGTGVTADRLVAQVESIRRRGGARIILLWPDSARATLESLETIDVERIIYKPIAGAALIEQLRAAAKAPAAALVSKAA
ncbi:MAG: ATP-binding protein [Sphingomonas bacterium]|nr:ATP-binding protein [Sphingomonas bacterium]